MIPWTIFKSVYTYLQMPQKMLITKVYILNVPRWQVEDTVCQSSGCLFDLSLQRSYYRSIESDAAAPSQHYPFDSIMVFIRDDTLCWCNLLTASTACTHRCFLFGCAVGPWWWCGQSWGLQPSVGPDLRSSAGCPPPRSRWSAPPPHEEPAPPLSPDATGTEE